MWMSVCFEQTEAAIWLTEAEMAAQQPASLNTFFQFLSENGLVVLVNIAEQVALFERLGFEASDLDARG